VTSKGEQASVSPAKVPVTGATRVVGLIGWPVSRSISPAIHNAAFEALGLDWVYVPLPVAPGSLPEAVGGLRALGFEGANVTMPHKEEAARLLNERSEDAARLQAVNTIVSGRKGWIGHNTDAPGFAAFLRQDAGFDPSGRSGVLLGAGGAARACALALARGGLSTLTVMARLVVRGEGVQRALRDYPTEVRVVQWSVGRGVEADVIVNATPLSDPGDLPVPAFTPRHLVVDLRYRPIVTPVVRAARQAGATAFGGLGMLIQQAALSFELWTGRPAPVAAMSAAALAALADAPT